MLNFWIWLIFISQFDSDKNDIDIRDVGKKVTKMETKMEEILEQLQASTSKMEQLDAEYKDKEEDVNAQSRRVLLLENESGINVGKLSDTILLINTSLLSCHGSLIL